MSLLARWTSNLRCAPPAHPTWRRLRERQMSSVTLSASDTDATASRASNQVAGFGDVRARSFSNLVARLFDRLIQQPGCWISRRQGA
jgi:hypothetical protein